MSDPSISDQRRAAAVIQHHARGDSAGVVAIIEEANDHQRGAHLVAEILNLYAALVPILYTPTGMQLLASIVMDVAMTEAEQ